MIVKIPRRSPFAALASGALVLALGAAAAGQSVSAPRFSTPRLSSEPGTSEGGSSGRLRMAYQYVCLNKASYARLNAGLVIDPEDVHSCTANSANIYAARCVFTEPGGGIYQEHVEECGPQFPEVEDYVGPVPQYQCDYLHALLNNQGVNVLDHFNGVHGVRFPYSPAQQRNYLAHTYCLASDAYSRYLGLAREPEKFDDAYDLAMESFFWEKAPPSKDSYFLGTSSFMRVSRYPYLRPLIALNEANEAREQAMVRATAEKMKSLRDSGLNQEPGGFAVAQVNAWLDRIFDHSKPNPGDPAAPVAPASRLILPKKAPTPDLGPMLSKPEVFLPSKFSSNVSPPLPSLDDAAAVKKENFGARGLAAAAQRLEDEYKIYFWHYFGMSRTIGNPGAALQGAIEQKSGTCGVESQYEALRARGFSADPAALAKEARSQGWYGEEAVGDPFNGTTLPFSNALLTAHHLHSTIVYRGTTQDLEQSIDAGGGAIVALSSDRFWRDKPGPVDHAVYVSGAELGSNGKILGYYVNDTGTGEGMRFVSARQFEEAWEDHTGHGFLVSLAPNARPPKVEFIPTKEQLNTVLQEAARF